MEKSQRIRSLLASWRLSEATCRIYDNRTTIGFERGENPIRRLGDSLGRVVEQMPVPLEHHPCVRVPQTARDCERIFSGFDEQRVSGVAQAVERNVRHLCLLEQRFEDPPEEVTLANRCSLRRREDEPAL